MTSNHQIALTLSDSHGGHLNPHGGRLETTTNSVCQKNTTKNCQLVSEWIGSQSTRCWRCRQLKKQKQTPTIFWAKTLFFLWIHTVQRKHHGRMIVVFFFFSQVPAGCKIKSDTDERPHCVSVIVSLEGPTRQHFWRVQVMKCLSPVTNTLKQTSTSSCQHEKQNTRRCSRIRATCFACVCYVCVYPLVERERATCAPDGDRHSTEGSAGRVPCPYTHRAAPPSHGTV